MVVGVLTGGVLGDRGSCFSPVSACLLVLQAFIRHRVVVRAGPLRATGGWDGLPTFEMSAPPWLRMALRIPWWNARSFIRRTPRCLSAK